MRHFKFILLTATSLFLAFGCSSMQKKTSFQLRPFQEVVLPNGLRVLYIEDQTLPRISLQMMVKVGSGDEEKGQEGLNALTAALLDQGTAKKSANQIADEFGQIGSEFSDRAAADYTVLNVDGLSLHQNAVLDLYAEVITTPKFDQWEVERRKSQQLAAITKQVDQPSSYTDLLLDQEIFGNHSYRHSVAGLEKSVKRISRTDVVRHYFKYFRPNNSILAVAGQFDDGFKARVAEAFGSWQSKEVERPARKPAPAPAAVTKLVSKKGLQQAQVRIGHLGIQRNNPDFLKLRVANLILGGAFASRLNQRVRDDLGLTYSISSAWDARINPGSFEIQTFTRHDKLAKTIEETRKVFEDYVKSGPTEKELQSAKNLLTAQFPAAVETVDGLGMNLMLLRLYGVSDDYLTNFFPAMEKMTLKEVNVALKKAMQPEAATVLIFADEAAAGAEQLKTIPNLKIEKYEERAP